MGIRTYIGWLSREKYNKIKDLTFEDKQILIHFINNNGETFDEEENIHEDYLYVHVGHLVDDYIMVSDTYLPSENSVGISKFFTSFPTHSEFSGLIMEDSALLELIKCTEEAYKSDYKRIIGKFVDENGQYTDEINKEFETGVFSKETQGNIIDIIEAYRRRAVNCGAIPVIKDLYITESKLNLDLDSPLIADSSYYEDDIYDLVRIYKSFNWDENVLVWMMW